MTRSFAFVAALALGAAVAPLAARADDARAFTADTRRFGAMRSFRMEIDSIDPRGTSTKYLTYVAPDKLRIEQAGSTFVAVVIGKLVWLRTTKGTWHKATLAPGADPLAAVHDPAVLAKAVAAAHVRLVGNATIEGKRMRVYQIDARPKPGFSAKSSRIWIGADDGFPHRLEQKNGPYASTTIYSAFNQALSISGPR